MPRVCIGAAGILLAVAAGGVWGDTVVYSTSFEGPTFAPGNLAPPLAAGQGDWRIEYDDPGRIQVVSGVARTGTQSVRFLADLVDPSSGWAWYDPVQINPIAAGTPLVTVEFAMRLAGSGTFSSGWGMEVFSTTLNSMGRMQVNAANVVEVDNGGTFQSTGVTVGRNAWNSYKLVFDFLTNRYDVLVNNNLVADNYVFNPDNGVIGDVDLRHLQLDPASDVAFFDDYSISTGGQLPSGAEWNINGNGNWNVGSNWSTGFVPNGATISAKLGSAITGPRQINVDAQVTLNQLQISSPIAYTLAGNPAPGSPAIRFAGLIPVAVQVSAGSHEFRAPVKFDKDSTIGVFAGSTLRFSDKVDMTARNMTKSGEGTLLIPQVRANSLTIEAGAVKLTGTGTLSGPSSMAILNIGAGSLDLSGHTLVLDYTAGSPAGTIRELLLQGRLVDSTNTNPGLTIGYADNTVVRTSQIDDLLIDDTALIAKVTIRGDANLDGIVDIADFSVVSANFNRLGLWGSGDFTYNGTTDLGDFAVLANVFNNSAPDSNFQPKSTVPDPITGTAAALTALLLRRSRTAGRTST